MAGPNVSKEELALRLLVPCSDYGDVNAYVMAVRRQNLMEKLLVPCILNNPGKLVDLKLWEMLDNHVNTMLDDFLNGIDSSMEEWAAEKETQA